MAMGNIISKECSPEDLSELAAEVLDGGSAVVIMAQDGDWLGAKFEELWEEERGRVAAFLGDSDSSTDMNAVQAFASEQFRSADVVIMRIRES